VIHQLKPLYRPCRDRRQSQTFLGSGTARPLLRDLSDILDRDQQRVTVIPCDLPRELGFSQQLDGSSLLGGGLPRDERSHDARLGDP
jgi:hypothetical protein